MNSLEDLIPRLLTTAQLRSRGLTGQSVNRAVKSGDLIRLRPGFYVEGHARELERRNRHLLSVLAANAALDEPVFSHASAALLHGLPDWGLSLRKVSMAENCTRTRSRSSTIATTYGVPNLADHVTSVGGVLVTNPERTVTDIALTASREAGVTVADAALNRGLVSRASLADSIQKSSGRHGIERARDSLGLVDEKSESVAESLSRLVLLDFGLPTPETQVEIVNDHGIRVARVDFLWPEYRVVGECDGFGKYFDGLSPAETRQRLAREKDRDAELMALGYRVLHWRWRDVMEPARLAERIRRVLFSATV